MSKRIEIKGEGSIQEIERGRIYRIRLRIPPTEPGGKRKWSPTRTIHGNKAKARQEIETYRKELEEQLNNSYYGLTIGEYARQFQENRRALESVSPLTIDRDELEIRRIENTIGSIQIQELNTTQISKTYESLRKEGISQSGLFKFHQKLKQILNCAVKEEIIPKNPCDLIDGIKRPPSKRRRSLSQEQAIKLAKDLKESERNGKIVAIWLALATGIRRGEALGLLWESIDLDKKRIFIEAQLDSKGRRRNPKSRASMRMLSIDDGTVTFLSEWKKMQSSLFYRGKVVPPKSPVCTNEHGDFIEPNVFNRWRRLFFSEHGLGYFEKKEEWYDRNGIKRYRYSGFHGFNFHELRHTQATLLIGSGADIKTVQNRLGHSSASLTMDIYAHAIERNDREAANVIGSFLSS